MDLKRAPAGWRDWLFILFASPAEQAQVEKETREEMQEDAVTQPVGEE